MILQHLILPTDICNKNELYFRINENVKIEKNIICMDAFGIVTTDTYFNLFDAIHGKIYGNK